MTMNLLFLRNFSVATLPLILLSVMLLPGHADAAGIGYVNAGRLIDESPQGLDQYKKLEAEFAERKRELRGRIDLFKAREDELEKESVLLTAEQLENKADGLRAEQTQLRRAEREYSEDYLRRRNQGLSKLEKVISEAVIAVAKREKLDAVFQQAAYASPEIDLTDKVLDELKKRYQK